jgi:large subunit ribosomal protein L15
MKLHELSPAPVPTKTHSAKAEVQAPVTERLPARDTKARRPVPAAVSDLVSKAARCPFRGRVPKRGFVNIFATKYATSTFPILKIRGRSGCGRSGAARVRSDQKTLDGVKVLGNGEHTKKLTVNCAAFSASAKEKIEKAGGKAEVK